MALDFSLLGKGPQFGGILASYTAGQEARREQDVTGALALYDSDPEQGVAAMMKADPEKGMKLREDYSARKQDADRRGVFQQSDPTKRREAATATGDPAVIEAVMKMDGAAREEKREATDAVGGFAFGLRAKVPYEQRRALIQQNAAGLTAAGFTPEQIASFDPTDANLDGLVAQMQTLDQAFKFADQEADNARADVEQQDRSDYRGIMASVAQQNAGTRATVANRPRPPAGGARAAPAPYSPGQVKWD